MVQKEAPIILELFSGAKTVSGVFEKNGWNAWSVDNNPKLNPSICCNILNIIPGMLPYQIHFIWASPPCTTFSRAANPKHWEKKTLKYRRYVYLPKTPEAYNSLLLLQKTIEIISWFPDVFFVIENPVGRIQHMNPLQKLGHFRYFVNYFDFGKPYSKETYLFSNVWLPFSLKKYKTIASGMSTIRNVQARASVPALLIENIYNYIFYHKT